MTTMYCGILNRSDVQSVHRLALTRFSMMCEQMITSDQGPACESSADDEISVGSDSPAPCVTHSTDDSMEATEPHSPLPKETPLKASPELPPPAAHQQNAQGSTITFSIDNILKPEFGQKLRQTFLAAANEQPVNLSHVNSGLFRTSLAAARSAVSEQSKTTDKQKDESVWPAWVYCTRYSDRPSAGPRTRRIKKRDKRDEKRPRTAFTSDQLGRLKKEFQENRYLTEKRRQDLARDLGLNESQIKIWFQNKRAKIKKQATGSKNPLALQLMAQGLYNHSTIPVREEDEDHLLSIV